MKYIAPKHGLDSCTIDHVLATGTIDIVWTGDEDTQTDLLMVCYECEWHEKVTPETNYCNNLAMRAIQHAHNHHKESLGNESEQIEKRRAEKGTMA